MQITLKLGEARSMLEPLQRLGAERLPVKTAYWLGRDSQKIFELVKSFEARRIELVTKHGVADGKGSAEAMTAFQADYAELCEIEETLDLHPQKLELLDGAKITPVDLVLLKKLIEEPKD